MLLLLTENALEISRAKKRDMAGYLAWMTHETDSFTGLHCKLHPRSRHCSMLSFPDSKKQHITGEHVQQGKEDELQLCIHVNVESCMLRSCSLQAQSQPRAPCKEEAPLKNIGLGSIAHSATVQTHGAGA